MEQYIQTLLTKVGFPEDAVIYLMKEYRRMDSFEQLRQVLSELCEAYADRTSQIDFKSEIAVYAQQMNMNKYTAYLLFLAMGAEKLEQSYAEKGLPDQMFWDIMADLFYKARACYKMYGVWGIFTFGWFRMHFCMKLFALGRFQYEISALSIDQPITLGGITLQPNQRVYNFHIPASGESLTQEVRYDSYRKAMEFFCKDEDYIVLTCGSWLLYPEYRKVYPQGSHLMEFMNDFHLLRYDEQQGFPDAWRVFYKDYNGSTEGFPAETTLQRNFIKWLNDGHHAGDGYGVFIFDGKKVINKI